MTERLDILILGATGFTGMHCIPPVSKFSKEDGRNLTWGIAGRTEEKLKQVLERMGKKIETDLSKVPIVIFDINDDDSLLKMARRANVVINCCGPFRFLGEAVIKACIEAGTHHVDVSGEPQFIETMQLKYDALAKEKGVYIVSACGLDSIPSDLGTVYLQKQFDGVLNSVVTYLETGGDGSHGGPVINYGTWASLVHSIAHMDELKSIRKQLYPERLPTFKPKLERKMLPGKASIVEGWTLPFMGADRPIMARTQRYFYEKYNMRPVQVDTLLIVKSFVQLIGFIFMGVMIGTFSKWSFGRKLLLNYPAIFSFGFFGKEEPSEEMIESSWFRITFYGEGWKEKLADKDDQYSYPPDKCIIGRVKGKNPGYGTTCVCLAGSALMILTEKYKLPEGGKGGVYTPGIAFGNTSLVDLLNKNEVTFEVLSQKDL